MSGSGETADANKDDEGNTPTPNHGKEVEETSTVNRRGNQSHRRTDIVQLHTSDRYFKGNTP